MLYNKYVTINKINNNDIFKIIYCGNYYGYCLALESLYVHNYFLEEIDLGLTDPYYKSIKVDDRVCQVIFDYFQITKRSDLKIEYLVNGTDGIIFVITIFVNLNNNSGTNENLKENLIENLKENLKENLNEKIKPLYFGLIQKDISLSRKCVFTYAFKEIISNGQVVEIVGKDSCVEEQQMKQQQQLPSSSSSSLPITAANHVNNIMMEKKEEFKKEIEKEIQKYIFMELENFYDPPIIFLDFKLRLGIDNAFKELISMIFNNGSLTIDFDELIKDLLRDHSSKKPSDKYFKSLTTNNKKCNIM
ncbi:hypothetical protein ABK040_010170 [Willaertia magna]